MDLKELINSYILEFLDEVMEVRREFHRYPELSLEEFETQKRIAEFLERHGIKGNCEMYASSVVVLIEGKLPGKCVALRSDMDALPVSEDSTHLCLSENQGVSHACGHDFHMAMLLGAALVLNKLKEHLNGQVKIIFQPCEEQAHRGGSWALIEKGVLENPHVDAIFATHLWPELNIGQIGICQKEMMSCCDVINITIHGRGGHISLPHKAINPIYPAAQLVGMLAEIRTQMVGPFENIIIDLGKFQSGFTNNVIPDKVDLGLNVRAYDNTARYQVKAAIENALEGLARMYHITYDLDYIMNLPALNNDAAMGDLFRAAAAGTVGEANVICPDPAMSAEDFGGYLEKIPGAFSWLGIGEGDHFRASLHNPMFEGNEKCLEIGIRFFVNTAVSFLNK